MFTSSVYYAQYILAGQRVDFATMDEATIGATIGGTISTYMGFISMGALFSMMVLMPIFLKKFKTGYKSLIVSQILTVVCYLVLYFTGRILLCTVLYCNIGRRYG